MEPKWQHKKGEQRMTPKGTLLDGTYDLNYCSFSLNAYEGEELHEMLDRIAENLLSHEAFFSQIQNEGGRAEFFVGWYSTGNTGDVLNNNLLNKLAKLKIDLALDIYSD